MGRYFQKNIPVEPDLTIEVEQAYAQLFSIVQQKQSPIEEGNMYEKELEQQKHLKYRLRDATDQKIEELQEAFYIEWKDLPKTPAEIKARLTAGQYTLNFGNCKDDVEFFSTWLPEFFSWRTVPADEKGYEAARELMEKDKTAVIDQIYLSYEAGLKALQDFEAKTYH